jgi:hypothetical protein
MSKWLVTVEVVLDNHPYAANDVQDFVRDSLTSTDHYFGESEVKQITVESATEEAYVRVR